MYQQPLSNHILPSFYYNLISIINFSNRNLFKDNIDILLHIFTNDNIELSYWFYIVGIVSELPR